MDFSWIFTPYSIFALTILIPVFIGILINNTDRMFTRLEFISTWLAVIFIILFLLVLISLNPGNGFFIPSIQSILTSIFIVFGIFFGFYGDLYSLFHSSYENTTALILGEDQTLFILLYITAYVLTISVIFAAVLKVFKRLQYDLCFFKKMCIFSSLSEETLITARSLLQKYPRTKIVIFSPEETEKTNDYKNEAYQYLNAIIFDYDITQFKLNWRFNSTYILLNKPNNLDNIADFVTLVDNDAFKACKYHNTDIYLFNTSDNLQLFLNNYVKQKKDKENSNLNNCFIKYVDVDQNEIYQLFLKHPIYNGKDNVLKDEVKMLIIGTGNFATKILRTAFWMGVLHGKTLKITIASSDFIGFYRQSLSENYPELKSQNNIEISFNSYISIDRIKEIDPDYIVIATDDEKFNINYSLTILQNIMKEVRESETKWISIFPWVPSFNLDLSGDNPMNFFYFDNINNEDIKVLYQSFGSKNEAYSYSNIFTPKFDHIGFAVYLMYKFKKDKDYLRKNDSNQSSENPFTIIHHTNFYKVYKEIFIKFFELDNEKEDDKAEKWISKIEKSYNESPINNKTLKNRIQNQWYKFVYRILKPDPIKEDEIDFFFNSQGQPNYRVLAKFENDYFENEYDRRSSIASGIHLKYKLESKGEKTLLAQKEHIRWMHYLFSQGFSKTKNNINENELNKIIQMNNKINGENDKNDRVNPIGKTHICLVDWDEKNLKIYDLKEIKNKESENLDQLDSIFLNYSKNPIHFKQNDVDTVQLRDLIKTNKDIFDPIEKH